MALEGAIRLFWSRTGGWAMNKGFFQTVAIVICAVGTVYTLYILQKDGTLQSMWEAVTSGSFGGFPL